MSAKSTPTEILARVSAARDASASALRLDALPEMQAEVQRVRREWDRRPLPDDTWDWLTDDEALA